jgi:hypothetical protein
MAVRRIRDNYRDPANQNLWNRLNVATRQVAGEWKPDAAGEWKPDA